MTAALACIPLMSAMLGWMIVRICYWSLFHPVNAIKLGPVIWQGYLYKKEPQLKIQLIEFIKSEIPVLEAAAINIAGASKLDNIKPQLNDHIDLFLNVRLKQAMPIIGSFIGDRTIGQLKALFMEELETLFPSVIASYIGHIKDDVDIDQLISNKVKSYSLRNAHQLLKNNLSDGLVKLSMAATLVGFILGCIEMLLLIILLPQQV